MTRFSASVIGALALSVAGCVIAVDTDHWKEEMHGWQDRQEHNLRATEQLTIGRTRDSVVAEMGQADFTEAFVRDGRTFDVLFYRTRLVAEDGRTTKDETTPLVFVDNALVGWGDSAIDKAAP
jgi:hypothetical protein